MIVKAGVSSVSDDGLFLFFHCALLVFEGVDWLMQVSELRVKCDWSTLRSLVRLAMMLVESVNMVYMLH